MPLDSLAFFVAAATIQDEIIVTATRQPAVLATEPVSAGALSAEEIDDTLARTASELVNQIPGALVQAGSGQEHLTAIRSPVLTGGAGAGSFLYLQDGVPLRSAGFANVNGLFDAMTPFAERIEVVRGPGDVAYGNNALHGAVNVLSPDPLTASGGEVRLRAGAFDRYTGTVEVGGRGWFGAVTGHSDGGYRADSGVEQVKAQLGHGAELGGATIRTRLSVHHLEQETAGYVEGQGAYRDDDLRRSNPNPEAYRNVDLIHLSSEVSFAAAGWTGTVTPYGLWAEMGFKLHFLPSQAVEDNQHGAVGVQSTFSRALSDRTTLLTGLDLEYAEGELREVQFVDDIFSYPQGEHYDYTVKATTAAPFIRLRHEVTERLSVQGGVRVNATSYDYSTALAPGVDGRIRRPADRTDDFTATTAKLAATYEVSEQVSLWGSIARGARPPQTADLYRLQVNEDPSGIEPETLDMAELGLRFAGEDLRAEIVAFTGRKENFQFRDADGFTVTDGETTHEGVEVSADWTILPTLSARVSATLADHEYAFTRIVGRESEIIRDGADVDTAPQSLGFASLTWQPLPALTTSVRWHHVGQYYTDAANEHDYPGHDIVDLRGAYELSPRVELAVGVQNIFDERFARRADYAFGNARYFPGEERHAEAEIRVRW